MKRGQDHGEAYNTQARLTGKSARHLTDENNDRLHAETPYGAIGKVLRFGEEAVQYICPLALLWTMASTCEGFGMCSLDCLGGVAGDFILYLDDMCNRLSSTASTGAYRKSSPHCCRFCGIPMQETHGNAQSSDLR